MSFKVETLLKKATSFEKLAVYSDRKVFLKALAQSAPEAVSAATQSLDGAVQALHNAVNQWINSNGQPQPDLPAGIKGLPAAARGYSDVIRGAASSGVSADNAAQVYNAARRLGTLNLPGWQQTVTPATLAVGDVYTKQYQPAIESYRASVPAENAPEAAPTAPIAPTQKPSGVSDPETVGLLQQFLNNALRSQIVAGARSPLVVDKKFGPDTLAALKLWAKDNGVNASNVHDLINIALNRANK